MIIDSKETIEARLDGQSWNSGQAREHLIEPLFELCGTKYDDDKVFSALRASYDGYARATSPRNAERFTRNCMPDIVAAFFCLGSMEAGVLTQKVLRAAA